MINKLLHFLMVDIWRIKIKNLPPHKYLFYKPLRVILLALRGFDEDKCQLRASALTFYSLLSVVPIMAMAFGIAKGFGFQHNLEILLTEKLKGQEEVLQWIIEFANSFLTNAKGGLIAGVGIAILFWTVIKVLGNIERSFNDIWGIRIGRSFGRRVSDYLSIVLICPVLLIMSSSITVFITSQVTLITEKIFLLGKISTIIFFLLKMLPYCVLWILFTFVYMFMPNTKVPFKSAFVAGIIAGTLTQFVQWAYLFFQIGVAKYNAIYGSFAALPLFLIWLQISWLVVLFGAEISFAVSNEETYEFEKDCLNVSRRFKMILALRTTEICIKNFISGEKALNINQISHKLEAPIRLTRQILYELVNANILAQVKTEQQLEEYYQPAISTEKLTIQKVISLLEKSGHEDLPSINKDHLEKITSTIEAFDQLLLKAPQNTPLADL